MKTKNVLSITEARRELFGLTDRAKKNSEPFFLTEHGKLKAVLLSAEEHERLCQRKSTMERAENSHLLGALNFFRNTANFGLADFFSRDLWMSQLLVRDGGASQYATGRVLEANHKEKNLILAQLYVELNDKYGYESQNIELGKLVRVGNGSIRHFAEADMIVYDSKGDVDLLVYVAPSSVFEKEKQEAMEELFNMAAEIARHVKVHSLVYFTKCKKGEKRNEKCVLVDFRAYKKYEDWKKSGEKCAGCIPKKIKAIER